jgi:hypothetical protein
MCEQAGQGVHSRAPLTPAPLPAHLRYAGLALEGSVHVMAMLWLRWLIAHRRGVYLRHRELLLGLVAIHACWVGKRIGAVCHCGRLAQLSMAGGNCANLLPCSCR